MTITNSIGSRCFIALLLLLGMSIQESGAADWQISNRTSLVLDAGEETVNELSGVTYLGTSPAAGKHRFAAVQNAGGKVITIDVEFSPTGSLLSASAVGSLELSLGADFEGIAFTNPTRDSVFLAEEEETILREFSLTTGDQLQTVPTPAVFANRRGNRGFESLTRSLDGTQMWTATEAALTVDGDTATATNGTTVRLLHLGVSGNTVASGAQYAYEVEPIHSANTVGTPQNGLTDLVQLPDGSLLALERSVAFAFPIYLSRIFAVDLAEATDVGVATLSSGLIGQSYTPVSKELLWSGAADGSQGQNLEGLSLGPRLANGDWVLLGVVDNGEPPFQNLVVAFVLTPNPSADFDEDGDVDGDDFLHWQRGFGKTIGALHSDGDADRDGDVDSGDLEIWQNNYPKNSQIVPLPEPHTFVSAWFTAFLTIARRRL